MVTPLTAVGAPRSNANGEERRRIGGVPRRRASADTGRRWRRAGGAGCAQLARQSMVCDGVPSAAQLGAIRTRQLARRRPQHAEPPRREILDERIERARAARSSCRRAMRDERGALDLGDLDERPRDQRRRTDRGRARRRRPRRRRRAAPAGRSRAMSASRTSMHVRAHGPGRRAPRSRRRRGPGAGRDRASA